MSTPQRNKIRSTADKETSLDFKVDGVTDVHTEGPAETSTISVLKRTKIVSIGDEETSLGFKLAGISDVYTEEPDKASHLLRSLAEDPEIAILIITEEVAKANEDVLRRIKINPYPVVVEVPGKKAQYESAEDKVRILIKMALGIDIDM